MNIFSRFGNAAKALFASQPKGKRAFSGAQTGRLYSDWLTGATSTDAEIRNSYRLLLDRSRDLERNNDYMRGYLGDCEDNIVGSIREDLRMDCGDYVTRKDPKTKKTVTVWQKDEFANRIIETAWIEWCKKGNATVCGKYSWRDVKRLAVRTVPRDGNFIARKIRGAAAKNRFGFAIQLWEIDHLDLRKFQTLQGGGEIRFGVEYDADKRPVAYWLMARHPGDFAGGVGGGYTSSRFSAEEIYHVFVSERAEQSIGIPWIVSAITRLRQLGAFEEAAVIAARLGASKAGFFETTGEGDYEGPTDEEGKVQMQAEPGQFEQLPQGMSFKPWDPAYPNITTGDFRKAMLRGVATSLGTSYVTLGNDLEAVNFSSARVGLADERETWKKHQLFFEESFYEPVFADWLEAAITNGAVNLPLSKFYKFNRPRFKSRRWVYIDPSKEIAANREAIALRIDSRRNIIEQQGGSVEDVFHDIKDDDDLAEAIGIELDAPDAPSEPAAMEPPDDEETPKKPDPANG